MTTGKNGTHKKWEDKTKEIEGIIELSFPIIEPVRSDIVFWKHRADEGYKAGYQADLIDRYVPDKNRGLWIFKERVRVWRLPYHMSAISKTEPCPTCRDNHKKNPKAPKVEILLKASKL